MVTQTKQHNILWMAPSALWGEQSAWMRFPGSGQGRMARPVILRFANDLFMDEMIAMLTHTPWRLAEWVARHETWRNPMPTPKPVEITRPKVFLPEAYNTTKQLVQNYSRENRTAQIKQQINTPASLPDLPTTDRLKLYQPIHQRYYVVTGSLVSGQKGLPDYLVDLSARERTTFVVRALKTNTKQVTEEFGFVATSTGMAWQKLGVHGDDNAAVMRILPNEEQHPLFPVTYPDRCDRFRQVFGGLIPVSQRDVWMDAPAYTGSDQDTVIASPVPSGDGGTDLYREILYADVIAPWKAMIDQAETDKRVNSEQDVSSANFDLDIPVPDLNLIRNIRRARDEIQTGSWYVLLDFARFLYDHLPGVWAKIAENENNTNLLTSQPLLSTGEEELVKAIIGTRLDTRLFLDLAVENLAVSGFQTQAQDGSLFSVWDKLLDFWKFEIYLKLSWILSGAEAQAEKVRARVTSVPGFTPGFRTALLSVLSSLISGSKHSFPDLSKALESSFPAIKEAAVSGIEPGFHTDLGKLIHCLNKIKIPAVQHQVVLTLNTDALDSAGLEKSLWSLLVFYWTFEAHVEATIPTINLDNVAANLDAGSSGDVETFTATWLQTVFGQAKTGNWYPFTQFASDLENHFPKLYAQAIREVFGKPLGTDAVVQQWRRTFLKNKVIDEQEQEALFFPNTGQRNIRIIPTLAQALVEVLAWDEKLEAVDTSYDRSIQTGGDESKMNESWPDFLFPLTDPHPTLTLSQSHPVPKRFSQASVLPGTAEDLQDQLDELATDIYQLVKAQKPMNGEGNSAVLNHAPLLDTKEVRFVVRLVFERPHCGRLFQPRISPATCKFDIAPFFDFEAPARSVKIRMPFDISPAGLRKYKKSAMVLFSDLMCGKVKKTKKMTLGDLVLSVLPWPFHKDLPDVGKSGPCRDKSGASLGMICSLSIPIVTLCALILLSIIVKLFNIFFKWMPWFFMCFPLPNIDRLKVKD
ncbi:hypothetical protein [Desulfobacter sp.]|uniref:hypothetical protein n=1 Tax=Desulfobacter sp. TaxID=2294 RepID=UPI003D0D0EF5